MTITFGPWHLIAALWVIAFLWSVIREKSQPPCSFDVLPLLVLLLLFGLTCGFGLASCL